MYINKKPTLHKQNTRKISVNDETKTNTGIATIIAT